MAKWDIENIVLTSTGEEILAKVASGVGKITLSRVVSGKTKVNLSQLGKLNAIPNEAQEFTIQGYSTQGTGSSIDIQVTNADLDAEYELWQIGVYVLHQDYAGEQLYYVAQATTPDVIPVASNTPLTMNYSLFLQHSGESSIVITPDWSGLVRQDIFENHRNSTLIDEGGIHGMKYIPPATEKDDGYLFYADADGNWIEIETGAKMEKTTVTFEEATELEDIKSGDLVPTLFGKIKHIFKYLISFGDSDGEVSSDVRDADTLGGVHAGEFAKKTDYNGIICVLVKDNWVKQSDNSYVYTIVHPSLTGDEFFDVNLYDDGSATQEQIDTFNELVTRIDVNAGEILIRASQNPPVTFSIILRGMCIVDNTVVANMAEVLEALDRYHQIESEIEQIKASMGGYSLKTIKQSDYDALTTKDSNTLYFRY